MKSAYLYVRVSTDEQKRKGYSLPEQEDRLLKYCEYNNITVKGIFREDFSAKTFNRPEWKKLLTVLKKDSLKEANNVLVVKWDRFSRNVEFSYEMIGILRKYKTTVTAIDQPVDFGIPESSLMHAVYLAIPQAENERRSLNTKNGIRRAKQLGRYPSKAPIGYSNQCAADGGKYIAPHWPDADLIKWSFQQLAKNAYRIEDVRRMANARGLQCSRSNFWKLLHNPVYCGYVPCSFNEFEEKELVKGIHEPLITPTLYNEVQNIINTRRKIVKKTHEANEVFVLLKYLICPICNRKLYGSFSKGRSKRYPYYHCKPSCKIRYKANVINESYAKNLGKIKLSQRANSLFEHILRDVNTGTQRNEYLNDRKSLSEQLKEQELFISKARRLFVTGKIEFDDFSKLKKDYLNSSGDLNDELNKVIFKLSCVDKQLNSDYSFEKLLSRFTDLNTNDKKHLISFISPAGINTSGDFLLQVDHALSKILLFKKHHFITIQTSPITDTQLLTPIRQVQERNVSIKKAVHILTQNNVIVNESEASVILDFLYLIAKFCKRSDNKIVPNTISENRTAKISPKPLIVQENRPKLKAV